MASTMGRAPSTMGRVQGAPVHPLHAILLAFPVAFFVGAALTDYAYWSSQQIQWTNFSSWLIAAGLTAGGAVLLWALVRALRMRRSPRAKLYFAVLLAMWLIGFANALVHSKDGWAAMPMGLALSIVVAVLALVAAWIGYSGVASREVG